MQRTIISEYKNMWEIIKDILRKKACFHDWKLVKENRFASHFHYIYVCQKCGKIKKIDVD